LLVYAGARRVGNVAIGYDLRVTDEMGSSRWLGSTEAAERWPRWVNDGKRLVYARATSTDLYQMTFE
jgi:Tol biopolymer transport system component